MIEIELGAVLKKHRETNNLGQQQLAYKVGWKNATLISKIESGSIKNPKRQTLINICEALNLTDPQKNQVLYLAGILPNKDEIEAIRKVVSPVVDTYPYPVTVYDFSYRILHENPAIDIVYTKSKSESKEIRDEYKNVLELHFTPTYRLFKFFTGEGKDFMAKITAQFLYENRDRTHQTWYKQLLDRLMKNPHFFESYKLAQKVDLDIDIRGVYEARATIPGHEDKLATFTAFNNQLISDNRVFVEYLIPKDKQTQALFESNLS